MNLEQLYDQAQKLLAHKQHNDAYKILKRLDAAIPDHPGILYLLAACQSLAGNKESAIKTYHRVLNLQPNFVEAMNNAGLDLKSLGRYQEAIALFDNALKYQPAFFEAQLNKASTLLAMNANHAAFDLLLQLRAIAPEHPMVLANLGTVNLKSKNAQAALEFFSAARRQLEHNLDITNGYLATLAELKCWEAIIEVGRTLPTNLLEDRKVKDTLLNACLQTCEWQFAELLTARGLSFASPLNALCVIEAAPELRENISFWSQNNYRSRESNLLRPARTKIRLGYISADFKTHPVAFLSSGLFSCHNHELFDIHGIAIDRVNSTDDPYRKRISSACNQFHEVGDLDDSQLTTFIQELELDILIDLGGHTNESRSVVLSQRCAPVQIQYLGFPGTMGASFIDYTIGDSIITPQSHFKFYSEKIISLPDCFQVNDNQRKIGVTKSRAECQLPEEAFVFACFNQQIKFTPALFDGWLQILQSTPGSVLWLARGNDTQAKNLIKRAKAQGIEPNRLIFADKLPYEEHLARYALVDLVLDTYPFNGGTTSSDALWGGAPVLTRMGDAYSSRMTASLLHNLKLDELITDSFSHYTSLAIELAKSPKRLTEIRGVLHANLTTAPIFNTQRFVRHLETGLETAVKRSRDGLKPDHIFIPLLTD